MDTNFNSLLLAVVGPRPASADNASGRGLIDVTTSSTGVSDAYTSGAQVESAQLVNTIAKVTNVSVELQQALARGLNDPNVAIPCGLILMDSRFGTDIGTRMGMVCHFLTLAYGETRLKQLSLNTTVMYEGKETPARMRGVLQFSHATYDAALTFGQRLLSSHTTLLYGLKLYFRSLPGDWKLANWDQPTKDASQWMANYGQMMNLLNVSLANFSFGTGGWTLRHQFPKGSNAERLMPVLKTLSYQRGLQCLMTFFHANGTGALPKMKMYHNDRVPADIKVYDALTTLPSLKETIMRFLPPMLRDLNADFTNASPHGDPSSSMTVTENRALLAKYHIKDLPVPKGSARITSSFTGTKLRHLRGEKPRVHLGTDIHAKYGSAVYAPSLMRVNAVGFDPDGWGKWVSGVLQDGSVVRFCHLSRIFTKVGSIVNRHGIFATSGDSGHTQGPHLHVEHEIKGKKVDPAKTLSLSHVINS